MGVNVIQLTSKKYHENILGSLRQLWLQGHLNDVTVQVDYEGGVREFQAHKVMLAASSGYFKDILLSQDASPQDRFLLSNMHFDYFSKFLEFVYTGKIEVARGKISDVLAAALSLDCKDLAEVCGEAMTAGILDSPTKKQANHVVDNDDLHGDEKEKGTKRKMQPKGFHSSPSPEKEVQAKRSKDKDGSKKTKVKKLKLRLAGRKVLQRRLTMKQVNFNNENKASDEDIEMEAQEENPGGKDDESFLVTQRCPADDWECEEDEQSTGPEEALMLSLGDEEEEEEEQSTESSKRASKAQFQCNKCQRTFHYERSYLKHISTYHGVKADVIYRCEICQQTFANRSNLKIHEKHVHSTERLFSCDRCTKTFKRKKDVVRHERQVHDRDNLQHVCSLCGKSLSSKTALLLHERTHTGAKPFECTECSAKFTQNSALKMHRRIHTGEKPFACEDCNARFTQKHMLIYHKRSHTGEKPFMCEACGKSFSSKEYLRHHSNIHTGSKPYKCEQCSRCFAQRNSLHQHLKIHTGERPYSCKDCEKQFTQLNALQRHQRIHTGEKPYMCGLCSRTFTDKSTLRRHTMIHDSDAPWKTYLVVLEGNIEDKKTKSPSKGKVEKAGAGEKKATARKSIAPAVANDGTSTADSSAKTHTDSVLVPAVPVTLPSDWTTHGAIAVVSHGTVSGIAVIHTEVPPGTQLQPIVTTEGMATGVISLDTSAIPVPFSIPVPIAHPIPLSSEASTISLSVPVSDGTSASVPATSTICKPSVLEAAASQIILAPISESSATSQVDDFPSDIQSVVADNCETENMDAGQQRTEENPLTEPKQGPPEDAE